MTKTKQIAWLRKMKFEEVCSLRNEKRLSVVEAAQILSVSERTFRRWYIRYKEEGLEGLEDRRIGKEAHNAAPVDEVMEMLNTYESRYSNFNVSHFYDKYRDIHKGTRSYNWVKKCLQGHGLVTAGKKKVKHRKRRERYPREGMMLHQDGSTHTWIPGVYWDLIVTMDDASNRIYSAFFVDEECTMSSFQGVRDVISTYGIFCSLYTDRGSHYWYTPKAGGKVDKKHLTQFRRAMKQIGIEMIAAYSPEARGRSERLFKTLQDRLPKELALEGITTMEAANKYLRDIFIPAYNKRFMVKPEEPESAFVPWLDYHMALDDILCIQEERMVKKDNTVSYNGQLLQIPKDTHRYSYQKARVRVHEYVNNDLALFYGPRCLGRYNSSGVAYE